MLTNLSYSCTISYHSVKMGRLEPSKLREKKNLHQSKTQILKTLNYWVLTLPDLPELCFYNSITGGYKMFVHQQSKLQFPKCKQKLTYFSHMREKVKSSLMPANTLKWGKRMVEKNMCILKH